jgi:predicted nucleic acid-binding protein
MNDGSYFADTNLLLYSFDSRNPVKQAFARQWIDHLWDTGAGRISWQVLHEFYANAARKIGLPVAQARQVVMIFTRWQPTCVNSAVVERAWHWMDRAQLSYWDALILASAERVGCQWLLSEDFQDGRNYDGVTVMNPFRKHPPLVRH